MSSISQLLASKEVDRRNTKKSSLTSKLKKLLSPIQLKMVEDPARFKIGRCGRRAGKTFADIVYMLIVALERPNTPVLYVGLTRDSAKAAVWSTVIEILDELDIVYEPLISGPIIRFANGSYIQLFGADTPNARNRLRGRKYKLIIVDEMGFFIEADGLIKSMLPMLADYKGTLLMTSSPGERLSGFFYEADQGKLQKSWSKYNWTLLDNPHFMADDPESPGSSMGRSELDTIARLQFGGNTNHPSYRREYLGEWIADNTSLVYPFNPRNVIEDLNKIHNPEYAIGIDLGSSSDNAIVAVRFSEYSRKVQVVKTFKRSHMLIDELYQELKGFIDEFKPIFVIADTGGYGAGIVQEFRRRYHLSIMAAEKTDKSFYQRIVSNDLISGFIEVLAGNSILEEWSKITKDEDGDELKGTPNHASDAFLYVYRKIYNTYLKTLEEPKTEEQRMIDQIEKKMQDKLDAHKEQELEMWEERLYNDLGESSDGNY